MVVLVPIGGLVLGVAAVHVDDEAVAGVLAVVLEDALHVEVLVELPIGVAVAHQGVVIGDVLKRLVKQERPQRLVI